VCWYGCLCIVPVCLWFNIIHATTSHLLLYSYTVWPVNSDYDYSYPALHCLLHYLDVTCVMGLAHDCDSPLLVLCDPFCVALPIAFSMALSLSVWEEGDNLVQPTFCLLLPHYVCVREGRKKKREGEKREPIPITRFCHYGFGTN